MRMRALRWNLVVWKPSAGPADPYGAPRFAHIAWTIRARWRPIFLGTGVLLMFLGLALPSTVAFIAGMLAVGSSAPAAGPRSPTAAMVRAWVWLREGQANHR
jgi:hypothetical protein